MQLSFLFTYLAILVAVMLTIWVGFFIGRAIRLKKRNGEKLSLGSITGAMLALLAFTLALTLSLASSRYATRNELVLEEANALNTAILRTDFLEEPLRSDSRKLLVDYINVRALISPTSEQISEIMANSEKIQEQLWTLANEAPSEIRNSSSFSPYVESLIQIHDLHTKRYNQGIQVRLPRNLWFLLYFVTGLTMLTVGYEFGMDNSESFIGSLLLAIVFSTIVFIILDLDQPGPRSLIGVSQQPMLDLKQKLNSSK